MKTKNTELFLFVFVCALLGFGIDFLSTGVFKVIWFVIYGPTYFAAGAGLNAYFLRGSLAKFANFGPLSFFCGAILCHLIFVGHKTTRIYLMNEISESPLIFQSPDWPQELYLTSPKLQSSLASISNKNGIPVRIRFITDYGCVRFRSLEISSIHEVNIANDSETSWTWKTPTGSDLSPNRKGAGNEDQNLPWCWIRFYRS